MTDNSYGGSADGTGRQLQPASQNLPPEGISEADYDAIEDAVMETARGRWFLKEYARRMRASETASLHAALERIERIVTLTHAPRADADAQLKMRDRMEGICERLLDISWFMRERGFSGSICSSVEEEARQLASLVKAFELGAAHDDEAEAPGPDDRIGEDAGPETEADSGDDPAPAEESQAPSSEIVAEAACEIEIPIEPEPQPAAVSQEAEVRAEPTPGLASRLAAFVHIDAMPVRQRLALCA
jgi:hypothetical protein